MITIAQAKKQANILKEYLAKANSKISHSSCLHAISKINGYDNWNTMSSVISKHTKLPDQENDSSNQPITIHEPALLIMSSKLSENAYRLINAILVKLENNSFTIKGVDHQILGKDATQKDFATAINELLYVKFFRINTAMDGGLLFNVNPNYFWKGEEAARFKAISDYADKIAIEDMSTSEDDQVYIDFPSSGEGIFNRPNISIDISTVVFFAETKNKSNRYPKKIPKLALEDNVNIEDHPKLKVLLNKLNAEKPVSDPRSCLPLVIEVLGKQYQVGYGGTHISITNNDDKSLATITAGINT